VGEVVLRDLLGGREVLYGLSEGEVRPVSGFFLCEAWRVSYVHTHGFDVVGFDAGSESRLPEEPVFLVCTDPRHYLLGSGASDVLFCHAGCPKDFL